MKNHWFCSLDQTPDSTKIPKKNFISLILLDIQTHPPLSPIIIGFISSVKIQMKNSLVGKQFRW